MIVTENKPDWVGAKGKCDFCNWEVELEENDIPLTSVIRYKVGGYFYKLDSDLADAVSEYYYPLPKLPPNCIALTYHHSATPPLQSSVYYGFAVSCPKCGHDIILYNEIKVLLQIKEDGSFTITPNE